MDKKIIFSGIQPSGNLHIGNYIGAIKQWINLQNQLNQSPTTLESVKSVKTNTDSTNSTDSTDSTDLTVNELIFCIVDLHAITVKQDPKILREKILEVAALYIACGINPEKSHIFVQSENHDHSYLAWIFDCITPIGWLNRMTQFKDKSNDQKSSTSVGLFNYPALMAADILLYDTDIVPVGEDQAQHVELTNHIAEKFNRLYGEVFKYPKVMIDKESARLMSLQNPLSKMSKSDENPLGTINILDSAEEILNKIKRAVTDSGTEIVCRDDKPALSNLLVIYSKLTGITIADLEKKYQGIGYGKFKQDLAQAVDQSLASIRNKYQELMKDKTYLNKVLDQGRDYTLTKSQPKILQVKKAVGLGR